MSTNIHIVTKNARQIEKTEKYKVYCYKVSYKTEMQHFRTNCIATKTQT